MRRHKKRIIARVREQITITKRRNSQNKENTQNTNVNKTHLKA